MKKGLAICFAVFYLLVSFVSAADVNEFWVLACEDANCNERARVFSLGEKIYFNFITNVDGLAAMAIVMDPDGEFQNINLPGSIVAERVGSYKVEGLSSKDNYDPMNNVIEFVVVSDTGDIRTSTSVRGDLDISGDSGRTSASLYMVFVMIGVVSLLILLVLVKIFMILYKRKKNKLIRSRLNSQKKTVKQALKRKPVKSVAKRPVLKRHLPMIRRSPQKVAKKTPSRPVKRKPILKRRPQGAVRKSPLKPVKKNPIRKGPAKRPSNR